MYVAVTDDPVAAIREAARAKRDAELIRIGRFLLDAWLRRVERRVERAVRDLELRERRRAARPFRPLTADLAGVLAGMCRE